MKYFNLLLVALIFQSCSTKSTTPINFFPTLEEREGLFYKLHLTEPFTGSTTSTYSTGKPYVSASFQDGKFHGTYTAWHLSGQKMGESHYNSGKKNGMSIAWHENGNKASEVNFIDDKREGKLEIYFPTGEQSTEAFFKEDELDSTYTRWDMEGNVISVEVYEDGELVGE